MSDIAADFDPRRYTQAFVPLWVMHNAELKDSAKLLLIYLMSRRGGEWCGQLSALAAAMGKDRKTTRANLQTLCAGGFITVQQEGHLISVSIVFEALLDCAARWQEDKDRRMQNTSAGRNQVNTVYKSPKKAAAGHGEKFPKFGENLPEIEEKLPKIGENLPTAEKAQNAHTENEMGKNSPLDGEKFPKIGENFLKIGEKFPTIIQGFTNTNIYRCCNARAYARDGSEAQNPQQVKNPQSENSTLPPPENAAQQPPVPDNRPVSDSQAPAAAAPDTLTGPDDTARPQTAQPGVPARTTCPPAQVSATPAAAPAAAAQDTGAVQPARPAGQAGTPCTEAQGATSAATPDAAPETPSQNADTPAAAEPVQPVRPEPAANPGEGAGAKRKPRARRELVRSRPSGPAEVEACMRSIAAGRLTDYPLALEAMHWDLTAQKFFSHYETTTAAHPRSGRYGWPVDKSWQAVAEKWVLDDLGERYDRAAQSYLQGRRLSEQNGQPSYRRRMSSTAPLSTQQVQDACMDAAAEGWAILQAQQQRFGARQPDHDPLLDEWQQSLLDDSVEIDLPPQNLIENHHR